MPFTPTTALIRSSVSSLRGAAITGTGRILGCLALLYRLVPRPASVMASWAPPPGAAGR